MSAAPIDEARAGAIAAAAVGRDGSEIAAAHFVERLDLGNAYYLIVLGGPCSPGAVAAVDAVDGSVLSSARFGGPASSLAVERDKALELSRLPQPVDVRLVWAASRLSLSPLYPFWRVSHGASVVYVDRSGKVWNELLPAGPG